MATLKSMVRFFIVFFVSIYFFNPVTCRAEDEPTLSLVWDGGQKIFSRKDLLGNPKTKKITIQSDPSYHGQKREVQAIPITTLFSELPREAVTHDSILNFRCLDGFSATLDQARVLNSNPQFAQAWIAIELQNSPWPPVKPNAKATAGPFYLVWIDPEKSNIGQEEWPYQLAAFEVRPPLEKLYPHAVPDGALSKTHVIQKGFKVFIKNCFACHTMNMQGASELGPDLNVPYNPTEYLKESMLVKLIRNPQTVRHWPQSKMSTFNQKQMSNLELNHLLSYLKHMSKRKIRVPGP